MNSLSLDNIEPSAPHPPPQGSVNVVLDKLTPQNPRFQFHISQGGVQKGSANVLPDSGSVVDNLSTELPSNLGLTLHEIPESSYNYTEANGEPIRVLYEKNFDLYIDFQKRNFLIVCLVSIKVDKYIISQITMFPYK